jgi:hypothetical protein
MTLPDFELPVYLWFAPLDQLRDASVAGRALEFGHSRSDGRITERPLDLPVGWKV